jgi:hypothetical protein
MLGAGIPAGDTKSPLKTSHFLASRFWHASAEQHETCANKAFHVVPARDGPGRGLGIDLSGWRRSVLV